MNFHAVAGDDRIDGVRGEFPSECSFGSPCIAVIAGVHEENAVRVIIAPVGADDVNIRTDGVNHRAIGEDPSYASAGFPVPMSRRCRSNGGTTFA